MYKMFSSFFRKEIAEAINAKKYSHYLEVSAEKRREKNVINFPVGTKVIYRSNEPDPLLVGKIVDHVPVSKAKTLLCVVECEKTGAKHMLMSDPVWWDEEREKSLMKLQWWEQWNVMNSFAHTFNKSSARRRQLLRNPNSERKGRKYSVEEVLEQIKGRSSKTPHQVDFDGDLIKLTSHIYLCFKKKGVECASCGLKGEYFYKERWENKNNTKIDYPWHLSLYGVKDGDEVLMTRDHIIPKSKGGKNYITNYQTMCRPCNLEKGDKM